MPAAYAHLTFGRRVARSLPDGEMRNLIRQHTDLFEIGLQGPDILFFYEPLRPNPVSRWGHELHKRTARSFLERSCCRNADPAATAYLLGFICHFTLDSECHTLVEYHMGKTGRSHSTVETDLERELMLREGLLPHKHPPASYIVSSPQNAAVIAPFYGVEAKKVQVGLASMKGISRALVPGNRLKHTLISKTVGSKGIVSELLMDWAPDPVYRPVNRDIISRMEQAVPIARELMEQFFWWQREEGSLSPRFNRTFSYDETELAELRRRDADV